MLSVRLNELRRVALWLILATLAALVTYAAFRGYFTADFLINFSNTFHC
jgi:hypothetical protein